jgi:cell division protein YceG involved in septum cleavage
MKKIIISLLVVLILAAGGTYYYDFVYMKNRKVDMENAESIQVTAVELVKAYQTDEASANAKYLDKIVEVSGTVNATGSTQAGEFTLTLASEDPFAGVMATLDTASADNAVVNQNVTVKGYCKGFLSDVVLTSAIITK